MNIEEYKNLKSKVVMYNKDTKYKGKRQNEINKRLIEEYSPIFGIIEGENLSDDGEITTLKISWQLNDGKCFESLHSLEELEIDKEYEKNYVNL